jgi:N-acetylglucosaminyldiphosphoundecaprenol N-acetyl-beta-D-mannosaminyltransferase
MAHILEIDDCDVREAQALAAAYGSTCYGYVVTPNVDHVIRHYYDSNFRTLYAHAALVLLDSRFLALAIGLLKRQHVRVTPGSDLTASIFSSEIKPDDTVVLVGASEQQAEALRSRYGLTALHHINPPMNFINDAAAVEECLRAIECASPFRFCFLAIGSPQQEVIAHKLLERGSVRGLALCVGGSINFVTGVEKRAPVWMRSMGLEWLFRLLQNPRRLAMRYLIRGPRIFWLLPRIKLRLRAPKARRQQN